MNTAQRLLVNNRSFGDGVCTDDPDEATVQLHVHKMLNAKTATSIIKLQLDLSWRWPLLWSKVRTAMVDHVSAAWRDLQSAQDLAVKFDRTSIDGFNASTVGGEGGDWPSWVQSRSPRALLTCCGS